MEPTPSTSAEESNQRNAMASSSSSSSSPNPRWDKNTYENPAVRRAMPATERSPSVTIGRHSQEATHLKSPTDERSESRGEAKATSRRSSVGSLQDLAIEFMRSARIQDRRIYLTEKDAGTELYEMVHGYRNLMIRTLVIHQLSKCFEP